MRCTCTPKTEGPLGPSRDTRVARAIQIRLDAIEDEITDHDAQAEHHYRLACTHLAEIDDLIERRFQLIASLARVERRLIQSRASRLNGRAAA